MAFTKWSGVQGSNGTFSNATLGTGTITTIKGTKVSYPTVHATTKVSSPLVDTSQLALLGGGSVNIKHGMAVLSDTFTPIAFAGITTDDYIIDAVYWRPSGSDPVHGRRYQFDWKRVRSNEASNR